MHPEQKPTDEALAIIRGAEARRPRPTAQQQRPQQIQKPLEGAFEALGEDRYILRFPDHGITFDIDRLRREQNALFGELIVRCDLPGARVVSGNILSAADINMSSATQRIGRGKQLTERCKIPGFDWTRALDEFAMKVLAADREGGPAVDLREMPSSGDDSKAVNLLGVVLWLLYPAILFGDGGSLKSYLALLFAGLLAEMGFSVGLFDWELSGEEHRDRLGRLFPDGMPRIMYVQCTKPLVYEVDRLKRIVRDNRLDYVIYDSIAFACDGPPEAAEVAGRYFRAVRQIGAGSLHVAHVSKQEGADRKPFGSTFWHNGARSTWFVKLSEESPDGNTLKLGLFHRKANLGRLQQPVGLTVEFDENCTRIRPSTLADTPDLADRLNLRQRIALLLRSGALPIETIAAELDAKPNSIRKTINRNHKNFIVLEAGRVGLAARHDALPPEDDDD